MPVESYKGHQEAFLSVHIALTILPTLFFAARRYAKNMRRLAWTVDDFLLAAALFFHYATAAGAIASTYVTHVGRHISTASLKDIRSTLMILWALEFPYIFAMTLCRASISILFMRTFYTLMFPELRCVGTIPRLDMIMAATWFLVSVIVCLVHCRPVAYNWAVPIENSEFCFSLKPYTIAMASWGLVIDGITWSLPHFVVWRLQLRLAHKLAITVIFTLGSLNILIAVSRITSLFALDYHHDLTWDVVPALIWAVAQTSTAIILASCPLLRPVFEKFIPGRLTKIVATKRTRQASIKATTRIDVLGHTSMPKPETYGCFRHDGINQVEGPTFEVHRGFGRVVG